MPDGMMSNTFPKPYELAAKALFYEVMEWRYGPTRRASYDELAEQHQLGELLLAHFSRFETGLQQMIDKLMELNTEAMSLRPPQLLVVGEGQAWQIAKRLGIPYSEPATSHQSPATGSTASPAFPVPDRSPAKAAVEAPDAAAPLAHQS
jgi:hypothetical protein